MKISERTITHPTVCFITHYLSLLHCLVAGKDVLQGCTFVSAQLHTPLFASWLFWETFCLNGSRFMSDSTLFAWFMCSNEWCSPSGRNIPGRTKGRVAVGTRRRWPGYLRCSSSVITLAFHTHASLENTSHLAAHWWEILRLAGPIVLEVLRMSES